MAIAEFVRKSMVGLGRVQACSLTVVDNFDFHCDKEHLTAALMFSVSACLPIRLSARLSAAGAQIVRHSVLTIKLAIMRNYAYLT